MRARPLLTRRQAQMLAMLADDCDDYEQIAERCTVSPLTVRNTLAAARERLEVRTNEQAVARAVALNLVILDWKMDAHLLHAA